MNITRHFLFIFLLLGASVQAVASWRDRLGAPQVPQSQYYQPAAPAQYMRQQQYQQAQYQQQYNGPPQGVAPYQQPPAQWQSQAPAPQGGQQYQSDHDDQSGQYDESRQHDAKEDEYREPKKIGNDDMTEVGGVIQAGKYAGMSTELAQQVTQELKSIGASDVPSFDLFLKKFDRSEGIGRMVIMAILNSDESYGLKLRFKLKKKFHKNTVRWYVEHWSDVTRRYKDRGLTKEQGIELAKMVRLVVNQAVKYKQAKEDDYEEAGRRVSNESEDPDFAYIADCNPKLISETKDPANYDTSKLSFEAHQAITFLFRTDGFDEIGHKIFKRKSADWIRERWQDIEGDQARALRPLISLIIIFDDIFKQSELLRLKGKIEDKAAEDNDVDVGHGAKGQSRR